MEYSEYLKTPHWQEIRAQRLDIDNGKCALCGKGPPERAVHIHHLAYNLFHEDVYSDVITVCDKCHLRLHSISEYHGHCDTEDLYVQLCEHNLERFIESYESSDFVHKGDRDLCNLDTIRPLLTGFYPIRISDVQCYFAERRKEKIREWRKQGYTYDQILKGSRFSKSMIKKVFNERKES